MLRFIAGFLIVALLALGALYVAAGRSAPPGLTVNKPERVVGQNGTLDVTAAAPNARFTSLTITLEQNGRTTPLFTLATRKEGTVTQPDVNHLNISLPF